MCPKFFRNHNCQLPAIVQTFYVMKSTKIKQWHDYENFNFRIGLIIALAFSIMSFNYTSFEKNIAPDIIERPLEEENEIEVVRTPPEVKRTPPPPKIDMAKITPEVETPEFIEEPDPEPIPMEIPVDQPVKIVEKITQPVAQPKVAPKPPAPPIIEPKEEEPEFWKVVEEMPVFGDCKDELDRGSRQQCSNRAVMQFLGKNLKYPRLAKENGIEGTVVIRFLVDKEGNITDTEIVREIGGGCGKEALRVINKMTKWMPGKQQGKAVKVQFNVPVKFALN